MIESGLGGTTNNFERISLHTLPNPRPAAELWPDLSAADEAKRIEEQECIAVTMPQIGGDVCGYDLAGNSIAVPFVGAAVYSSLITSSVAA